MNKMKQMWSGVKLAARQQMPSILMGAGITFWGASNVYSCRAAIKTHDAMPGHKEAIAKYHEEHEEGDTKGLLKLYAGIGGGIVRDFLLPAAYGAAGVACVTTSHCTMQNRVNAMTSAFVAVSSAFAGYRDRVKERFGSEVEREIRCDIREEEITTTNENGETETKVVKRAHVQLDGVTMRRFGDFNAEDPDATSAFELNPDYNLSFLSSVQLMLTDRLCAAGGKHYLLLNEVFKDLGYLKGTKMGNELGWIYDPDDPKRANCVDFGIFDSYGNPLPGIEMDNNGTILLTFNVDGPIIDDCVRMGLMNN